MLVCNICNKEARYRVIIDCGRFMDRLFFCEKHKPQSMVMGEMDEKQHDTNIKKDDRQQVNVEGNLA